MASPAQQGPAAQGLCRQDGHLSSPLEETLGSTAGTGPQTQFASKCCKYRATARQICKHSYYIIPKVESNNNVYY